MTADLKPYSSYKPSGVEWLGDVPAHWDVAAVKRHYSIQLGKMLQNFPHSPKDIEVPYLKAQHVQWFSVRTTDVPTMWASLYEMEQFGIRAGDLLVCEGGEGGRCGLVEKVSPGYIIQNALHRVRALGTGRNDYLLYVMSSISRAGWFDAINNKATIAHFTVEKFGSLRIPIPPLAEQAAIVRYLDHTDGRIVRYLRSRERLIELLKEYRQAVVHEVVTRGLDPDVPLKPSGVEWLGDVPAHWEVRRLKHWIKINEAVLPETTDPDFDFRYLEIGAVGTGVLVEEPSTIRFAHAPSRARRIVKSGDTIISTVRTYLKAVWFAEEVNDALICSTGFAVLTPRRATAPKFVSYVVQNNAFTDRVTAESVGIAYPAIAESRFRSFHVCVPPLAEQAAIAAYLDKQTAAIDAAITRAQREIDLLSEYRTRLIADVVTGQVDVREVAGLPVGRMRHKTARAEYATD